jgi:hypothetical protein
MNARTSQGAIAWALPPITLSPLAVPAYWIFGRRKVEGFRIVCKELILELLKRPHQ